MPLSYSWFFESKRFFIWQQFLKLLFKHLRDVVEIDSFYFDLLEHTSLKLQKQNPKRVVIESYLEILEYEGRLHKDFICFICEKRISGNLTLQRAYLPSHKKCLFGKEFSKELISTLFDSKSTIKINDEEIEILWDILQEGL